MKPQKIEISSKTIVFTVFFILFLFFLWQIKELIFALILAFIIVGGLEKPATFLKNKIKLPHTIVSTMIYILFLVSFFYLFYIIIPPLFIEITHFAKKFPQILITIFPQSNQYFDLNFLSQNIPQLTTNAFALIKNIFSNVIFIISIFSFSFYFLIEEEFFLKSLKKFFDDNDAEKINAVIKKIQNKISFWFWGEFFLMFVVGVLTYIGLFILKIPFALPLAILAGLLEAVPNLGPTIAAVPSVIVGLSSSLFSGIGALILAILVQQLENNLLVPLIMKKFVGINPVVSLMALIIGGKIAGVLGVLLAIPTVLIIEVILLEILKNKK